MVVRAMVKEVMTHLGELSNRRAYHETVQASRGLY